MGRSSFTITPRSSPDDHPNGWWLSSGVRMLTRDSVLRDGPTCLSCRDPRVAECPLQFEAQIVAFHRLAEGAHCVEAEVVRVHAAPEIVIDGSNHIDPGVWQPLLYVFRHYFGPGEELGKTFRAET
jgi:hypothetical protein